MDAVKVKMCKVKQARKTTQGYHSGESGQNPVWLNSVERHGGRDLSSRVSSCKETRSPGVFGGRLINGVCQACGVISEFADVFPVMRPSVFGSWLSLKFGFYLFTQNGSWGSHVP